MITCVCDACKHAFPFEDAMAWRSKRSCMYIPFSDYDLCKTCETKAHAIGTEEYERAVNESRERTMTRLRAMFL